MGFIKKLLSYPGTYGLDLDDPALTERRREIISGKRFLNRVYATFYQELENSSCDVPPGSRLEIGSGAGFINKALPGTITSDIMSLSRSDLTSSGLALPFPDQSLSAIYLVNVFHHIPDTGRFLNEVSRTLKPGGRLIMIEPYVSPLSRLIYTYIHHEPLDEKGGWSLDGSGPLSDANGALPWIVFQRDRSKFESMYPDMTIRGIRPFMSLAYLVSGGVSFRSFMPGWAYPFFHAGERLLGPIQRFTAMFAVLVIERDHSGD